MQKPPPHYCQNCHCQLEEDDQFCGVCGQKRIEAPPTLRELLGDFFSNVFSLDSKLLRTMQQLIFVPGGLSLAYWEGKRQRYYTPLKLFLFWLTVVVLLFAWSNNQNNTGGTADDQLVIWQYQQSLKPELYALLEDSTAVEQLLNAETEGSEGNFTFFNMGKVDIPKDELYGLTVDELLERHPGDSFFENLFFRQLFKAFKRPNTFRVRILGNLSWILFISLPFLALVLQLLYYKKQPYYIAHLVFSLHFGAFGLVILTSVFVWYWIFPDISLRPWGGRLLTIGTVLYLGQALKRCFEQSNRRTFFKLVVFLFLAFFVFISAGLLFLLLNFLLF